MTSIKCIKYKENSYKHKECQVINNVDKYTIKLHVDNDGKEVQQLRVFFYDKETKEYIEKDEIVLTEGKDGFSRKLWNVVFSLNDKGDTTEKIL